MGVGGRVGECQGGEGWQRLPQWVTLDRMQTVAETPLFSRQADKLPIYALLAYSKSDKSDLTPGERRAVAALVKAIKSHGRAKQ